tara:strand:+ start:11938 stop:12357 length:420 start_codon:yes stop_codon:yes gene_type:complete
MFNFFKSDKNSNEDKFSYISLACLLIHAAKIDENYSDKEKKIIRESLIKLGIGQNEIDNTMKQAEILEKDSNQILEYTKEAKNIDKEKKIILVEALWSIIYSDDNADMYEANLMRRLSGLIYLDNKIVGDIKEKIKNKL